MNNNLKNLKPKAKLKFLQNMVYYPNQMNRMRRSKNFIFEEDPFSEGIHDIIFILHEALLFMNFCRGNSRLKKGIKFIMICFKLSFKDY